AHVHVEVDGDHEPAVVVEDASPVRLLGPRTAAAGNLRALIQVVEHVQQGVFLTELLDGLVGEHALHRVDEDVPFAFAPEVVDHEEAAAVEILAQDLRFALVEQPLSDLDGIEPRVVEHALVDELDQAAAIAVDVDFPDVDAGEAANALHDVKLGVGVVRRPRAAAAAIVAAPAVRRITVDEAREVNLGLRGRREARVARLAARDGEPAAGRDRGERGHSDRCSGSAAAHARSVTQSWPNVADGDYDSLGLWTR